VKREFREVDDLRWCGEAALPGESGSPDGRMSDGAADLRADGGAAEDEDRLALAEIDFVAVEFKGGWIERWSLCEQPVCAVEAAVLERDLRPTGFFRQKTKAVKGAALGIVERFGGQVPRDMAGLTSLHGVGRKTASIVLANAFGVPSIAVDRHVARVAGRLGFSRQTDPDKIEQDLRAVFREADWVKATWNLILHGRRICNPTPKCPDCPVIDLCPYPRKTKPASSGSRAIRRLS